MALEYRLQRDHSDERSRFGYDVATQRDTDGCARLRATNVAGAWVLTLAAKNYQLADA